MLLNLDTFVEIAAVGEGVQRNVSPPPIGFITISMISAICTSFAHMHKCDCAICTSASHMHETHTEISLPIAPRARVDSSLSHQTRRIAMGDNAISPLRVGKRVMHGSLTEVRNAKRGPGLNPKDGVRKLTMQNWTGDGGGCYLVGNINGTSFPINRNNLLLEPLGLKLTDTDKQKFYDFGWNAFQNKHITRTIEESHARDIANAIVARCTDLQFEIDLSNGKWYDNKGMLVWNYADEAIAFVGMDPFQQHLESILTPDNRTTRDVGIVTRLDWADSQPAMVFKCRNAFIEKSIDAICDMVEKFGFDMSMAKINVPAEGSPPPQAPGDAK